MRMPLELTLKLINRLCQTYVFLLSFFSLVIFFNVTLPKVSDGDHNSSHHHKFLICFIFFNVWGNYICVWYKFRLSIVKSDSSNSLLWPKLDIFSHKKCPATSNKARTMSQYINSNNNTAYNYFDHLKDKLANSYVANGKEHKPRLTCADYSSEMQELAVSSNNSSNNDEYNTAFTYNTSFTYNHNLESYTNDFSQENMEGVDRESVLTSRDMKESTAVIAGWTNCKDCNIIVPPRAKHCPLCRHCVVKRDHHCFFVGCCVGFHNQRYFIIFCLYAGVAAIYNSVFTLCYLRDSYEASHTWGYLAYFFPIVFYIWLTGDVSGLTAGMIIFLYLTVMTSLVCCYYFCVQIFLVYRGQTNYEYLKRIKTYQGTFRKNWISVFGGYWPIGFFIPAPFLGYGNHDGIDWTQLISDNKIV